MVELFVFIEMGGTHDQIELEPLRDTSAEAAYEAWLSELRAFDVRGATSNLAHDRERLVAMIEHGYGGGERFNGALRRVLEAVAESNRQRQLEAASAQRRLSLDEAPTTPVRRALHAFRMSAEGMALSAKGDQLTRSARGSDSPHSSPACPPKFSRPGHVRANSGSRHSSPSCPARHPRGVQAARAGSGSRNSSPGCPARHARGVQAARADSDSGSRHSSPGCPSHFERTAPGRQDSGVCLCGADSGTDATRAHAPAAADPSEGGAERAPPHTSPRPTHEIDEAEAGAPAVALGAAGSVTRMLRLSRDRLLPPLATDQPPNDGAAAAAPTPEAMAPALIAAAPAADASTG